MNAGLRWSRQLSSKHHGAGTFGGEVIQMSRIAVRFPAAALLVAAMAVGTMLPRETAAQDCGDYGTSVTFVESPTEAAKQALRREKLVFVLHVSGNFELPEYT